MTLAALALGLSLVVSTPITGKVTYRERIALPEDAELVVSLDRFDGGHRLVSEVRMVLDGAQVPISFAIPFVRTGASEGEFGVRAAIVSGGKRLFESEEHTPVLSNGQSEANIVLVRATAPEPAVIGVEWKLRWLEGAEIAASERGPTLTFLEDGTIQGFSSVNGFGGEYAWSAPSIQIDPGAMTMMAGPPELMAIENGFLRVLPIANRLELFEGELVLKRGERELARFTR